MAQATNDSYDIVLLRTTAAHRGAVRTALATAAADDSGA